MKKIIDRKRYDTDKATFVTCLDNGEPLESEDHCCEELFRTEKGAFFIVADGGSRSMYAKNSPSGQPQGRENVFTPITEDQAIDLLERWEETDALELYWPDIEDA